MTSVHGDLRRQPCARAARPVDDPHGGQARSRTGRRTWWSTRTHGHLFIIDGLRPFPIGLAGAAGKASSELRA